MPAVRVELVHLTAIVARQDVEPGAEARIDWSDAADHRAVAEIDQSVGPHGHCIGLGQVRRERSVASRGSVNNTLTSARNRPYGSCARVDQMDPPIVLVAGEVKHAALSNGE